jgi:hypothetical protein
LPDKKSKSCNSQNRYKPFLHLILVLILVPCALGLVPSLSFAAQITLAWYSNTESDLAGYRLYYGTASGNYSASIDVGNTTQYTLTGLQEGLTYYFALKAYDQSNNESGFSSEVAHTMPVPDNPDPLPENPPEPVDTDGDGIADNLDAFPQDPAEITDTDNDGTGNNADTDDDNDGMPDAWEIQYGLDPLVDDASEDADLDGISNLDEFLAGTDPIVPRGNSEPDSPVLLSPSDQEQVTLAPMLQTDAFYDPDPGDVHAETRWRITRQKDNVCVLDVISPNSLNSLEVPKSILDENTKYIWDTRFYDSHGAPSEWSESAVFVTGINPEDSNRNGIPDDQEGDSTSDMDGDGILDVDQDTIKSVKTKGKKSQVGISFKGSDTVLAIEYLAYEDPQDPKFRNSASNKPKNFPFGLIDFRLLVTEPGDQAEITVYFSDRAPKDGKWYKYDPIEKVWYDYSAYAEFGANKKSITLLLEDGGIGDADRIANGIIVDPSGVRVEDAAITTGGDESSGGGEASCFIATAASEPSTDRQENGLTLFQVLFFTLLFLNLLKISDIKSKYKKIRPEPSQGGRR